MLIDEIPSAMLLDQSDRLCSKWFSCHAAHVCDICAWLNREANHVDIKLNLGILEYYEI